MQLLTVDALVPGDADAITDAGLVLDPGGRIRDVGPAEAVRARHPDLVPVHQAGVAFPALVNAHTHVELSWLAGRLAPGAGFAPWMDGLGALQSEDASPDFDAAIERAADELVAAGTGAIADITNTLAALDALQSRGLAGWAFFELLGGSPGGPVGALAEALAARACAPLRCSAVPHSLFMVTMDDVRELLGVARATGSRISIHLAEHAAERALLADRTGPLATLDGPHRNVLDALARDPSPVDAAIALGLCGPDVLAVHLADATGDEIARLAATRTRVVLCPRSNAFIHATVPPLPVLLAAGIAPALGTDSLASNTSLDVLAEAVALHIAFPDVPSRTLVSMATAWGADALGLEDLGRVTVGRAPGLVCAPFQRGDDPFARVLHSTPAQRRWIVRPGVAIAARSAG